MQVPQLFMSKELDQTIQNLEASNDRWGELKFKLGAAEERARIMRLVLNIHASVIDNDEAAQALRVLADEIVGYPLNGFEA